MKFYYGKTSPYARKVLIVLLEKDIPHDLIEAFPFAENSSLGTINPLCKIPALLSDDDELITNSPLICRYLEDQYPTPALVPSGPNTWATLNMEALGDGIMEAAFSLTMEKNRNETEQSPSWRQRWEDNIFRTIAYLNTNISSLHGPLSIAQISIAVALEYVDFRQPQIMWREQNSELTRWLNDFSKRKTLQITHPTFVGVNT